MQFDLPSNYPTRMFLPHTTHDRTYQLLLIERCPANTSLFVTNSELPKIETLFNIGDLRTEGEKGPRVGYIFYSKFNVNNIGSGILASSKKWWAEFKARGYPMAEMDLKMVLKIPDFYVYHGPNQATLIVNPDLASSIRANFEAA